MLLFKRLLTVWRTLAIFFGSVRSMFCVTTIHTLTNDVALSAPDRKLSRKRRSYRATHLARLLHQQLFPLLTHIINTVKQSYISDWFWWLEWFSVLFCKLNTVLIISIVSYMHQNVTRNQRFVLAWCLPRLPVNGLTQHKQQIYIDHHVMNLWRAAVNISFNHQIKISQDQKGRCNSLIFFILATWGFVWGGGLTVTDWGTLKGNKSYHIGLDVFNSTYVKLLSCMLIVEWSACLAEQEQQTCKLCNLCKVVAWAL